MSAFLLQVSDSSRFFSVVEEKNVVYNDHALAVFPHALHGKVNGVRYKVAHFISPRMSQILLN
jgi:hypothetical protein